MTYNPTIPQANDLISQSQGQIQTNFSQADTIFDANHYTFDNATVANRGKHRYSSYVEQGSDPATAAGDVAIYSKDSGTRPVLFFREESNGAVNRLTGGGITAAAWCQFNGSTLTINAQYNIASIIRTGGGAPAGDYTLTFTSAFSSTNYAVFFSARSGTFPTDYTITRAAGNIRIVISNASDTVDANLVIFGTLV